MKALQYLLILLLSVLCSSIISLILMAIIAVVYYSVGIPESGWSDEVMLWIIIPMFLFTLNHFAKKDFKVEILGVFLPRYYPKFQQEEISS